MIVEAGLDAATKTTDFFWKKCIITHNYKFVGRKSQQNHLVAFVILWYVINRKLSVMEAEVLSWKACYELNIG